MHYPDFPINSYQDFLRWYKGVMDNIVWNSHELQGMTISGDYTSGWNVNYDVIWKATAKNGDKYDMRVHQKLNIAVIDNRLMLTKLYAEIAK